ncbi:E3 ubiquitin-protein ligase RFWD3-like isoform X2 [Nilaparvata lugens]|uniref:E3 ubiquitin-protein ligase RFWD3-like isoform X2 n=1 Tax=Nilaparvata lugens TaxID=108931 RepID=UPI00193CB0C5|nr:E3 ubiquitin-protein ligase RFWD3-like isoform X2 [Nilaparvata lugens]
MTFNANGNSQDTDYGEDYDSNYDPDYDDDMEVDGSSLDSISEIEHILDDIENSNSDASEMSGSETDMEEDASSPETAELNDADSTDDDEGDGEDEEEGGGEGADVVVISDNETATVTPPMVENLTPAIVDLESIPTPARNLEPCNTLGAPTVTPSPKKRGVAVEEGLSCSICLDSITNSGAHRLVALKCGHVFGHNCVERWLKTGCSNGAPRCPDCNKKAKISDIRVIYAEKLQVLDTSEIERLKLERDKVVTEKNILAMELTRTQTLVRLQDDKIKILEKQSEQFRMNPMCTCASNPSQRSAPKKSMEFLQINSIEINKAGGCRVLAYSSGSLVVSQLSTNPLFAGFGVRRLDGFDLRSMQFVHLHKKPIRDMAFHPTEPNLLLTCSLDKQAKVIDTNSNSTILLFNDDTMLWSCGWSSYNQTQLYTGSQNGVVTLYDTRQPAQVLSTWKSPSDTSPVIALSALYNGGLLSCRFNAVQLIGGRDVAAPESVLSDGPFVSMSYNSASQMVVTTSRPSQRSRSVRHIVSQLGGQLNNSCLNNIHTFHRGTSD